MRKIKERRVKTEVNEEDYPKTLNLLEELTELMSDKEEYKW